MTNLVQKFVFHPHSSLKFIQLFMSFKRLKSVGGVSRRKLKYSIKLKWKRTESWVAPRDRVLYQKILLAFDVAHKVEDRVPVECYKQVKNRLGGRLGP